MKKKTNNFVRIQINKEGKKHSKQSQKHIKDTLRSTKIKRNNGKNTRWYFHLPH